VTDETEQKKPQRPTKKTGGTAREWVVSTVVGMGSGLVAVTAAIRREFNGEVQNWPGMKGPDGLTAKYQFLLDKCDDHYAKLTTKDWHGHVAEKARIKDAFEKQFIDDFLLKTHGIVTEGARSNNIFVKAKDAAYGTYQRIKHLGESNRKLDVWFKGGSVAIIVGVGTYNLLTSIATRKKAREIEDLILDKVLEEPAKKMEAAHRAMHAEPDTKISDVARHERLQAANAPEVAVRA
jgi:hypothetical protein